MTLTDPEPWLRLPIMGNCGMNKSTCSVGPGPRRTPYGFLVSDNVPSNIIPLCTDITAEILCIIKFDLKYEILLVLTLRGQTLTR